MSNQQNISYEEIKTIQKSIEDAITSQTNVVQRIQALRHSIQSDRNLFLDQLQTEITNAREELRRETRDIYNKMLKEVTEAASEILRSAALDSIRGRSLDQSGLGQSEPESSIALNQSEEFDENEEQNK